MDNIETARLTYSSAIIILNFIAAGIFYFNLKNSQPTHKIAIRYFLGFFSLITIGFFVFALNIQQPNTLGIVITTSSFVLSFHCLRYGFAWRSQKITLPMIRNPAIWANVIFIIIFNITMLITMDESLGVRSFAIIVNGVLILASALRYVAADGQRPTSGERMCQASIVIASTLMLALPILLLYNNDQFLFLSLLMLVQVIIVSCMLSTILSMLLTDVISLYQTEAITDPMTGLYNRRHFMECAKNTFASAQRHQYPVSIILFDIDNFKSVNDSFGHETGDDVIIHMANSLRSCVRQEDIVARFGGEEFVVLLPQTPVIGAGVLAERMREFIASQQVNSRNQQIAVTASFGVSAYDQSDDDLPDLIKRADDAMYIAKNKGKNLVYVNQTAKQEESKNNSLNIADDLVAAT